MDVVLSKPAYVFADFRLDPERRVLSRGGETLTLHPKAFDLLLVLVENRDRILSKVELLNLVWAEQFVEENNLAVQIFALRKIFGEQRGENRFIVTVPNKGYRFVAEVETEFRNAANIFEAEAGKIPVQGSDEKRGAKRIEKLETRRRKLLVPLFIVGVAGLFLAIWAPNRFRRADEYEPAKQPKLSRLTASGKITNATLSPDGKYAVFAQKETDGESLWLKQIATGSQTRIVAPEALEYVGLTVSPDNNFIYFSAFHANQADTFLRRIPLLGGAAQEIADVETGVSVSFSPDGKQFAFTQAHSTAGETYLKIADADGSNQRILLLAKNEKRALEGYKSNPAAWSPAGNEIACAVDEKVGDGWKSGILLVNPAGGERFLLAPRFEAIVNLAWIDAENLAFVAYETDEWSSQIWVLSRKTGEARKLTSDLNKYLWLAAAQGNLLTVQQNAVSSLQIADFDETVKTLAPREVIRETSINYVAFASDDSIFYTSRASGSQELWRVRKDGADPSQITADAQISYGFSVSPTDGTIVFNSARGGKYALWRADADGGNLQPVTDGAGDKFPQFTPDGKHVVFERGFTNPTVWCAEATTGGASIQLTKKQGLKPTVSPDGKQTAYYFMDFDDDRAWRVGLISTATGEFLGKLSFPIFVSERRMIWHPTGRWLTQIFNTGENINLLLMPTEGGEPHIISGLGKGKVNSFNWSRSGREIVFTQITETQDVVLLNDF